jgi:hypothetical protein
VGSLNETVIAADAGACFSTNASASAAKRRQFSCPTSAGGNDRGFLMKYREDVRDNFCSRPQVIFDQRIEANLTRTYLA